MMGLIMRLLGHKMVHKAMGQHVTNGGVLDVHLGLALLRDRRVPLASKALAMVLGTSAMFIMQTLEIPLETLIALLLPFFGLAFDFALDGLEAVAIPIIVASLLLPRLAPAPVVQAIRNERLGHLQPLPING